MRWHCLREREGEGESELQKKRKSLNFKKGLSRLFF